MEKGLVRPLLRVHSVLLPVVELPAAGMSRFNPKSDPRELVKTVFGNVRHGMIIVKSIVALGCASVAIPTTAHAIVITNLVSTANALSFDFAGTSQSDTIGATIASSPAWGLSFESHGFQVGTFKLGFIGLVHDGSGGTAAPDLAISGAYGTTQSNTVSVAHGTDLDIFTLTATVFGNGQNPGWSSYSGSFSAVHRSGVPDGGATWVLAGLATLLLAGARRFFRTA